MGAYNRKSFNNVGAHISVIGITEFKEAELKQIGEVGNEFEFTIDGLHSVKPEGWDEMERVWFISVKSEELEDLRKKYGLSPKSHGHEFHITWAVKKK